MDKRQTVRNPWAIVLLILAFSCALAYGIATLGSRLLSEESFGSAKALSIANIQDIQTTATGFVYYDGNTVSCLSSAGKVAWSYLVGANAGFRATDYGVAAWVDTTVTLIDLVSGSTTYNGTMSDKVLGAHIGDKYTAILTGSEYDSTIILMENGGKQVNQIAMNSVTAVDYGFFSDGTLLWVMVCDTNGTVPTCTIQTYKPGKEIVGSISDTEQLAYGVQFLSSQVCIAGDTYLKVYDYTGAENTDLRKLVYGWYLLDADSGSPDPLMAFVNDAQCNGASDIRDLRMVRVGQKLDRVLRLPFGCMSLVAMEDTIYGFSADGHITVLRTQDDSAQAYRLSVTIDEVYGVTRDNVAVLRSGETVYLVSLV